MRNMSYITPPANQGQIVTVSYCAIEDGIIERTYDASDRSESYRYAYWGAVQGDYEPQNSAPRVRPSAWRSITAARAERMIEESGPVRLS